MAPITGKHVLLALLSFFGVMLAANGVFVYFATTTFSGISTEDAYSKGLHYNDTITTYRMQQATGWRSVVRLEGAALHLEMRDANGRPVDGLAIEALLERPAASDELRMLAFKGAGNGLYSADVGALPAGQWQFTAEARTGNDVNAPPYKVTARLWQKP